VTIDDDGTPIAVDIGFIVSIGSVSRPSKAACATLRSRPGPHRRHAACLYVDEVMLARLKPVTHRFSHRVTSLLIDTSRRRCGIVFGACHR